MRIDRRLFLAILSAPLYPEIPLVVLTAGEAKVVEALCAQIVPADDWPGAKEAGVLYYIETQLAGPLERFVDTYTNGIPRLMSACREQTGKLFIDLDPAQQKQFLHGIEAGPDAELNRFWQVAIDHTMQGFYGNPKHGGNKNETSWKMLEIADVMDGHKH